ncbi:hypothetical protein CTI12_AA596460 [Artemisia annua]|uniref:Helitron helicase-like domain-containing protein n=1 Tax=Artemisia annua TaxID=35608 RepID=A0A2U1KII9_ARTAN|nr:hypothetical protein CTI12_AA596460 [Artemisia annua]
MKYNLKNNAQKNRNQLLENPNPNNASSVHGCKSHRLDQPSLSTSIVATSSSDSASTFNCDDTYSGPVMLDFGLQTVRHVPYEYSDFNKENRKITSRQLHARDAAPSNQTPVPLPTFFSTHRLKRSNVTNSFENRKITSRQLHARDAAPSNQTPVPLPTFFSTHRLKRSNVTNSFGEFLFRYSCNAKKRYVFILMPYRIRHTVDGHLKNADKVSRKRRKSAENTNECSNGNAANPVIEGYLHSASDADDSNHMSNNSCFKTTWENTNPATHVTTRPTQRCFSPSGLQISPHNVVYNRSQQPHCHATEGTFDNNTYLPPNVPASDATQSIHINNKRKAPANVNTRCVQQRLSTNGSQSTSTNGLYNHSEQQDSHATKGIANNNSSFLTNAQRKTPTSRASDESGTGVQHSGQQSDLNQSEAFALQFANQSTVYEDLGDCNERCRYCNTAFWHEERLKGHRKARMSHFTNSDTNPLDPQVVQGLIQFLDTHNELVQVFRTARDKCAENDVPEFKVRLYNGNGARGYELPTSQAIGAIVFDSGPTTEADYDIVIEYRYGPAKRINKLHQSYMSLQFPLIFIYG